MIHFCSGYLTFIWGKCKRSQHSIKWTIVAALNELQYSNNVECSDPCHCTGLDSRRLYWFISEEIWTPGILSQFLAYLIQILRVGWALSDCLVIVGNHCLKIDWFPIGVGLREPCGCVGGFWSSSFLSLKLLKLI